MKRLFFYTKPGCSLCDILLPGVKALAVEKGLALTLVDIRADEDDYERYRYRIPVVTLEKVELGWGRVAHAALREALEAALAAET